MTTMIRKVKELLGECDSLEIKGSDLKLNYPAHDPHNNKKKDQREFNHKQKDEVVRVINRVLKQLCLTNMDDVYRIELLIDKNYHEWNSDREEAIAWLCDKYEDYLYGQGFDSIKFNKIEINYKIKLSALAPYNTDSLVFKPSHNSPFPNKPRDLIRCWLVLATRR